LEKIHPLSFGEIQHFDVWVFPNSYTEKINVPFLFSERPPQGDVSSNLGNIRLIAKLLLNGGGKTIRMFFCWSVRSIAKRGLSMNADVRIGWLPFQTSIAFLLFNRKRTRRFDSSGRFFGTHFK